MWLFITRWGTKYFNLNNWAGYVDKINRQDRGWSLRSLIKYIPNRLTPLYSKIYYKEENYLKVKTVVFKYITPPYSKGWVHRYINTIVFWVCRVLTFPHSKLLHVLSSVIWLSYPSSYNFTSFISSASRILILTQYKSLFSTCTILFIRSVIPTPSSISLSLKNLISKSLIRGILYPILI